MRRLFSLLAPLALLWPAAQGQGESYWQRFTERPPQPPDGAYTVSAQLPAESCFWMCPVELRPGEDYGSFLRRAVEEYFQQARKQLKTVRDKGYVIVMEDPDAPEIHCRGIVLRNPSAPEASQDIIWPSQWECYHSELGELSGIYNLFLEVAFMRQGIRVCRGKLFDDDVMGMTERPVTYPWSETSAFLAALPELMQADPRQVLRLLPPDMEFPSPLRERVASGRRLLLFHAEEGLPVENFWKTWVEMVAEVGIQSIQYTSDEDCLLSPAQREARQREQRGPLPEEVPAGPDLSSISLPQAEVQPVIDLPAEAAGE